MLYTAAIIVALISYLLGSINPSIIISKSIYGEDIRSKGSGNAGATNMLRTHGKGMAIATLICDILKGTLAVVVAMWIDIFFTSQKNLSVTPYERLYILDNLKYIAGLFVVLGHDFPIFFGFRGGKGVATSLGVIFAINLQAGLIVLILAITIMATTRYVSLGSITAAAVYPFILFTYIIAKGESLDEGMPSIIMAILLAILLIAKHSSNIKKLRLGTENKLFAKKSDSQDSTAGLEETEDMEDDLK